MHIRESEETKTWRQNKETPTGDVIYRPNIVFYDNLKYAVVVDPTVLH